MFEFFESLESRSLLSAAPVHVAAALHVDPQAIVQPLATKLPKITGNYSGSLVVNGVHTRGITLSITKQTAKGVFSGVLTSTQNASIKVTVTGTVTGAKTFTIKLKGTHSGGPINATGAGTIAKGKLSSPLKFTQGSSIFSGSISLKKV